MNEFDEAAFSQRPAYDPAEIDLVLSKYCAPFAYSSRGTNSEKGIDVTKRKEAILKSLADPNELPAHIFGALEFGLFNNNI